MLSTYSDCLDAIADMQPLRLAHARAIALFDLTYWGYFKSKHIADMNPSSFIRDGGSVFVEYGTSISELPVQCHHSLITYLMLNKSDTLFFKNNSITLKPFTEKLGEPMSVLAINRMTRQMGKSAGLRVNARWTYVQEQVLHLSQVLVAHRNSFSSCPDCLVE